MSLRYYGARRLVTTTLYSGGIDGSKILFFFGHVSLIMGMAWGAKDAQIMVKNLVLSAIHLTEGFPRPLQ